MWPPLTAMPTASRCVSVPRFHRRATLRPPHLLAIKGARPREGPFLLPRPSPSPPLCHRAVVVQPPCSATLTPLIPQLTRYRAWVQRRAAPRPSRLPPRPPVRASVTISPSATSATVDSSGEPPSDLFLTSNRSTTPPPCHSACSPPTSGAGLLESPTAAVGEHCPLFPSRWATS
jgi:hypothetical protein